MNKIKSKIKSNLSGIALIFVVTILFIYSKELTSFGILSFISLIISAYKSIDKNPSNDFYLGFYSLLASLFIVLYYQPKILFFVLWVQSKFCNEINDINYFTTIFLISALSTAISFVIWMFIEGSVRGFYSAISK